MGKEGVEEVQGKEGVVENQEKGEVERDVSVKEKKLKGTRI